MKRNFCLYLFLFSLLLTACNTQGVENSGKKESVLEEQAEKWEVTDLYDNKVLLDINNVPEIDKSENMRVKMIRFEYPTDYIQVYNGHCYYMSYKEGIYTIYMDHGKVVGKFRSEGRYAVVGCTKYKEDFYVLYRDKEDHPEVSYVLEFGVVDFENQLIRRLHSTGDFFTSICNDQVFYYYDGAITVKDFEGNLIKIINIPEEWCGIWIGKKNLYYSMMNETEIKIQINYVDQNTEKAGTILEYERDKTLLSKFNSALLVKLGDTVYLEEYLGNDDFYSSLYIIDAKKKKIESVSSYVKIWTASDRYVFYTDKKHMIHRWDKKSGEDKKISKIKTGDINCVGDKLYIREYDEYIDGDEFEDDCDDYDDYLTENESTAHYIYTMDFEGKNVSEVEAY